MQHRLLLTLALSVLVALPAAAQGLKLSFENGLVSVDATSVPVRQILTEWEKIGGTKIVGADKLVGSPVTVKLINVTEAKALDIILRNAAGYMAAPRSAGAGAGPSMYDRILVMATSNAAVAPSAASRTTPQNPNGAANTPGRFVPPRPRPEQPETEEQAEPDENPPNPPVFTFPQQGPGGVQPGMISAPPNIGQPQTMTIAPATSPTTTPTMPTGAATPGMIIAPPPPVQPPVPGGMIRPPGRR